MAFIMNNTIQHLDLLHSPLPWALLLIGICIYIFAKTLLRPPPKHSPPHSSNPSPQPQPSPSSASYNDIQPIPLDLPNTPPLALRPFKPTYHMTMALESTTLSDLIAMDSTFPSRCSIRKNLIATQRHEVLAVNPRGAAAVLELYEWLVGTYLPQRYPSVYSISKNVEDKEGKLRNNVTGDELPPKMGSEDAERALELLGSNIDDEFLFLLPSSKEQDEGKYRLEAFINCFPSGFNTRMKLGMLLADVHGPVPGYKAKLEKSMDRFFASLPVGKIVKRCNWSISTTGELFCLDGNHMSTETSSSIDVAEEKANIDLRTTVLRCERQTLHRLPQTGALVFAFKTYQYPISELRDEGSGEILAEAIDGLGRGSVPDITIYKKQVVWGEKVKAYLRGEIDIDA